MRWSRKGSDARTILVVDLDNELPQSSDNELSLFTQLPTKARRQHYHNAKRSTVLEGPVPRHTVRLTIRLIVENNWLRGRCLPFVLCLLPDAPVTPKFALNPLKLSLVFCELEYFSHWFIEPAQLQGILTCLPE